MAARTLDPLTSTMVKLASLIVFCGLLGGCGGRSVPKKSGPALKSETVKYDWLELTIGDDGEHVYRAEIDSQSVRRKESITVEVKAGDEWINAALTSKALILSKLGKNARQNPIEEGRARELYRGADNEIIFLGGSFAFQGDSLRMVALLDGSAIRIGGVGGKIIPIECERSTIDEVLGKPTDMDIPQVQKSRE